MNPMEAHYAEHLGPVYAWMQGNRETALRRSSAELEEMGLPRALSAPLHSTALDLGAGLGLHSVALAKRGFQVTAIDSCGVILEELRSYATGLSINVVDADILTFPAHVSSPCDVIICLGDTLTHLSTFEGVDTLLREAAAALSARGLFAVTFRDYVSKTLEGNDRYILVRRDEHRILSCFLEYGSEHVTVHDILTQREAEHWVRRVSSYPKLRLAPERVISRLEDLGLAARQETAPSGMVRIVARNIRSPD